MGEQDSDARWRGRGAAGDGLRGKRFRGALGRRGSGFVTAGETSGDVDRLFRRESGRAVATLIAALGDFDLAEDAVQNAFATAMERWPREGVPDNPGAWITRVARNDAIDRLRRDGTLARKRKVLEQLARADAAREPAADDDQFPDERLRLIFTCCHPALAPEARVALTLRSLGGLTTAEIAHAFLGGEAAMAKRLTRAKQKIREAGIRYEVPDRERMPERLSSVLATIYLIFNEGYLGTSSEELLREELCAEAIRLGGLLATMLPERTETLALLALMELTHARRRARVGSDGALVPLAFQDRSRWDRAQLERGLALAGRARAAGPAGPYTVQAAIAAEHARAASADETDWQRIVRLYGWLLRFDPSPVVELNRAAAVAEADSPESGLALIDAIEGLDGYQPLHAARGELLSRIGRREDARDAYGTALELTTNPVQRAYLSGRLRALGAET